MLGSSKLLQLAFLFAVSSLATACTSAEPQLSSNLPLGMITQAPYGYQAMCQRDARECPEARASSPLRTIAAITPVEPSQSSLHLTPALWDQLNTVNSGINRSVRYETDEQVWGQEEYWAPAVTAGDCEDFALAKRDLLRAMGLPTGALNLAVVHSQRTGPHAVLLANTDQGAYVLDSSMGWILPWDKTDYTWVTAQDGAGHWRMAGTSAQAVLLAVLASQKFPAGEGKQTASQDNVQHDVVAGKTASAGGQKPYIVAAETGGR